MIRFAFTALLLGFFATLPAAAETPDWPDRFLAEKMAEDRIPGAAIALVGPRRTTKVSGYGLAQVGENIPASGQTVWRVGSNSKSVTATLTLMMAEEFDFRLDENLGPLLARMDFRRAPKWPVTLHQLLTHTAGFNEALFGQHSAVEDWWPLRPWLREHLTPQFIEPGEVIAYVDYNTSLAGLAIEQASQLSFPEYAESRLFGPLGMASTSFSQTDLPAGLASRRAYSYRTVDGEFLPYRFDAIATTPAAGLYTSAEDMAVYLDWLLSGWQQELESPEYNALVRTQLSIQARNHPALTGRAYGFAERHHNGWRVLYKDGQATGFNARLVIVPDAQLAFFIVHNATILAPGGGFTDAKEFIGEFTDEFLVRELKEQGPLPEINYPESSAALPLSSYVGEYRTSVAARHTWEKLVAAFDTVSVTSDNERLSINGSHIIPVGDNLFKSAKSGALRAFGVDEGTATHLFFGAGTYERIPWLESSVATKWIAIMLVSGFLATLIAAFFSRGRRLLGGWGIAASVSALAFIGGFAAVLLTTDPQVFFKGMPLSLSAVLALPPITVLLAATGFALGIRRGRRGLTVVPLVLALALCSWLWQWNLLGWQLT